MLQKLINTSIIAIDKKHGGIEITFEGNMLNEETGKESVPVAFDKLFTTHNYNRVTKEWEPRDTSSDEVIEFKQWFKDNIGFDYDEALEMEVTEDIPFTHDTMYVSAEKDKVYFQYFEERPSVNKPPEGSEGDRLQGIVTHVEYNPEKGIEVFFKADMSDTKTQKKWKGSEESTFLGRYKFVQVQERTIIVDGETKTVYRDLLKPNKIESAKKRFLKALQVDEITVSNFDEHIEEILEAVKGAQLTAKVAKAGSALYFEIDQIETDLD